MSHEIYSRNKAGSEVGYIRFTMSDPNAGLLYALLDADEYHAGVSGTGGFATISVQQLEKALDEFKTIMIQNVDRVKNDQYLQWLEKEMLAFISGSLKTALEEGEVEVIFA